MPVKADKVKFAIGDKVTFDMDGTDVKGEITKLKVVIILLKMTKALTMNANHLS